MSLRRFSAFILILATLSLSLEGCFKKDNTTAPKTTHVDLVYYKLYDNEDVMQPLIQQYQSKHPEVTIHYRKFTDPKEYEKLVVNELAEGQGPDIFSAPNYWFLPNNKKIAPLPDNKMTVKQFDQTFVNVASKDLTFTDPTDSQRHIFALPLTVDTLALYYNKAAYEDAVPSRGRPPTTWEQLKDDVFKLSKKDNSFERFSVAGISMGRSDNIARAVDILYLLMLQLKTNFYNDNISQATFNHQQTTTIGGALINPAVEALKIYSSFALAGNKNYSWNTYLANPNSITKELETFAKGKVAMIFGYSYLYDQLKNEIKDLKAKGVQTIDLNDIHISVVPQINDPATSIEKRSTFANYYAETVARTSKHQQEAWDFLLFLSSKDNLKTYNQKTHRPTSRRDLLDEQQKDSLYGVFAEQTGFAESFPIVDFDRYTDVFSKAIDSVLATSSAENTIQTAEDNISGLLPEEGLLPAPSGKTNSSPKSSQQNGN